MNQISKRLELAVQAARAWPADRQEEAAELLERMDAYLNTPYELSDEERADLEEALAEIRRGEIASDADVAAMRRRHGL
jgi:hypothetical protein